MNYRKLIQFLIALVWLVNGLYCKVLNFVPRHQDIIAKILEESYSRTLTLSIGISEIIMSFWVFSRYLYKLNAITQILLILCMNLLEQILAPELLLWGRFNMLYAIAFCMIIYYNTFVLIPKTSSTHGIS